VSAGALGIFLEGLRLFLFSYPSLSLSFLPLPSSPLYVAFPSPPSGPLKCTRGFGEGCKFPQQEPQTLNNLLNVLTNTTNFGETIPLMPHSDYCGGRDP